jgi:hypothetical protein
VYQRGNHVCIGSRLGPGDLGFLQTNAKSCMAEKLLRRTRGFSGRFVSQRHSAISHSNGSRIRFFFTSIALLAQYSEYMRLSR